MICNYDLQCPRCQSSFEVKVDTATSGPHYPADCPNCGKTIQIKIVESGHFKSLPSSKVSSIKSDSPKSKTKPMETTIASSDDEKIVFKCVQPEKPHEKKSTIMQTKHSKRMEVTPPSPDSLAPAAKPESIDSKYSRKEVYSPTPHLTVESMTVSESSPYENSLAHPVDRVRPDRSEDQTQEKPLKQYKSRRGRRKELQPIESDKYPGSSRMRPRYSPGYSYKEIPQPKYQRPGVKKFRLLATPEQRLKLAMFLLILVFIFGLSHGTISVLWGSPEQITKGESTVETVDIDGTVIDFYTGRPIPNCVVKISKTDLEDTTNSGGHYYIPSVDVGNQEIVASANGYGRLTKKVTVATEQPANFNFELKPGVNAETIDDTISVVKKEKTGINIFAVFLIIFACFALMAIILIWQRNMYRVCVFSSIISILSIGLGIGSILGVIALILILLSSSSFGFKPSLPIPGEDELT
jgi:hypothetical protein